MQLYLIAVLASIFSFMAFVSLNQLIFGKKIVAQQRIKKLFATEETTDNKKIAKRKKELNSKSSVDRGLLLNLSTQLSLADIKLRVDEFIILWSIVAFGPAGILLVMGVDWLAPLALFLVGAVLPVVLITRRKGKRISMLEDQLSNALIIVGNCLKTGLSFQQALESIVREMPDPISREFGRVVKEVQLGRSMEQALQNMANRLNSKDFTLLVTAVQIQRQVGGNLSEILTNISETIRERIKIKSNLKVLTSSGRISGLVVGLIPVFLMLALMVLNPSYVRIFFVPGTGTILLIVAISLEVVGFLTIRKIMSVKF